uniref:Uncharacterized protein n=1 Tax=viral metagenome TaxID=1070528 RepID=A0A6C0DA34_9ZZZZ
MNAIEEEKNNLRTRCGYKPSECIFSFERNLSDAGAVAIGKCLHFGIDLVCSGGLHTFFKILWEYSLNHINIGSPRVFMYLNKRMKEIDELVKTYPDETLYNNTNFQSKIGEMILILHDAPKHPKLTWPKVGVETHNESWIRGLESAIDTEIVNKVWKPDGDLKILKTVGNEICKNLADHSLERVLFWMKFTYEEESKVKKENSKNSLSTVDRSSGGKSKNEVGYYFLSLFSEFYKELAKKQQIRMHEEFLSLIEIFRAHDLRFTNSFKRNLLGLMARILCEVPRWKIPAANSLVKDPVVISRAIQQIPKFFHEVLQYPSVSSGNLSKMLKKKGKIDSIKKDSKKLSMEEQFEAFDKAMEVYMSK